jgi:hypothetical protein
MFVSLVTLPLQEGDSPLDAAFRDRILGCSRIVPTLTSACLRCKQAEVFAGRVHVATEAERQQRVRSSIFPRRMDIVSERWQVDCLGALSQG